MSTMAHLGFTRFPLSSLMTLLVHLLHGAKAFDFAAVQRPWAAPLHRWRLQGLSKMLSSLRFSWTSPPLSKSSWNSIVFAPPWLCSVPQITTVIWSLAISPPSGSETLDGQGSLTLVSETGTHTTVLRIGLLLNDHPSFLANKTPLLYREANCELWLILDNQKNQILVLQISAFSVSLAATAGMEVTDKNFPLCWKNCLFFHSASFFLFLLGYKW